MNPALEQRRSALQIANRTRHDNSVLLRELFALPHADGIERAAELVEACEYPATALPILRLLTSVRRLGEAKAIVILNRAGVRSGDRKLRDLTNRQREIIADGLRYRLWIRP